MTRSNAPERIERRRLAKDEAAGRRGPVGVEAEAGEPVEGALHGGVRLQPRQVHPDAHVRAVRERLRGLLYVPFRFESSGSQIIFFDQENDYATEEASREG